MKKRLTFLILMLLIASTGTMLRADFKNICMIKAKYIIPVTADTIQDGALIIENGFIRDLGTELQEEPGMEIISADTMYVYPGFIDGFTDIALMPTDKKSSNKSREQKKTILLPHRCAADFLDYSDGEIKIYRTLGITTVITGYDNIVFPGTRTAVGLSGVESGKIVLNTETGMTITFTREQSRYPSSLMAVIAYIRQTFTDADHHAEMKKLFSIHKRGFPRPEYNKALDSLLPVLNGIMPAVITADSENQIKRAVALAEEIGLNIIISGAQEGWLVSDLLKQKKIPVILNLDFPDPDEVTGYSYNLPIEGYNKEKADSTIKKQILANAHALEKEHIEFCFSTRDLSQPADMLKNIRKCIENGLTSETALRSLTITPARMFGIDNMVGSLERGKLANLVITTKNIFDKEAKIKYVFVDGKKFEYETKKKKKPAVNVTGQWEGIITSPMGEFPFSFELKQHGSSLTGSIISESGSGEISNGVVSGNSVEFTVSMQMGGQAMELSFSGTVAGSTMEGNVTVPGMGVADWSAEKPG